MLSPEMIEQAAELSASQGGSAPENLTPPTVDESAAMQQTVADSPLPEVEQAAIKFTKLLPFVRKLANSMQSQKGLTRVMYALAEFPLGKEQPRLLNDAERQLFHILYELQSHKAVILQDFMRKSAEMEKLKQTAVSAGEQVNVTSQE